MSDNATYWQRFGLQQEPFTTPWTRPIPSGYAQVSAYLEARLREAGGPLRPVFRPSALKLLVQHADADLARLDAISIEAMKVAGGQQSVVVTGTTIAQVLEKGITPRALPQRAAPKAGGTPAAGPQPDPVSGPRNLTLALLGIAVVGGLGLAVGLLG